MADFQGYIFLFFIWLISTMLIRALFRTARAKPNLSPSAFGLPIIGHFQLDAFFRAFRARTRHPPGPFSLPIIGHLHLLGPIPHQAFHKLSIRYGPVFRLFLGSVTCVVASSPEIATEFLKTYENAFLDRPQNSVGVYLTYESQDFAFAPYGSHWKFMKKIVMSRFLNGTTVDFHLPVRQDEIIRFMKSLFEKAKVGMEVDLNGELVKLTNNLISGIVLSKRCSEDLGEAEEVRKLVFEMTEMMGKFNLSDNIWLFKNLDLQGFTKRARDTRGRYDVLIERIMKEHEEARKQGRRSQGKDLLNILLDISEDESQEIKLTRENIKAFILNIFVAGTDNSAITVEWALAELINHPNIMKKAIKEIDQVVGKNKLLQESDIPNLPYLQAIVKETLRLHPPVPLLPRRSTEDCTVAGYHIPARTTIFINLWALGRDPNYWEYPLEFRPERFEESPLDVRGQHFQMLAFGSGRRMCPGTSLALQLVHSTLGAMIQCFAWKAGKDGSLASVDMDEGPGFNLPRANPLVCVPVVRLDPNLFSAEVIH